MLVTIPSFVLQGIDAVRCDVEVSLQSRGLPRITLVGLPDLAVRESVERVRSALEASGFEPPRHRTTISLAPADLRKQGTAFDLPIAVALLLAADERPRPKAPRPDPSAWMLAGELALDGGLRSVRGTVGMALLARRLGLAGVVVPEGNAAEAAVVAGVDVRAARGLPEVVAFFAGTEDLPRVQPVDVGAAVAGSAPCVDFREIRGQGVVKRALAVAAAGGHNALLIGPAGCGKTMMARAMPGILPPLEPDEALEVTQIRSAAGSAGAGLVTERPFRSPHRVPCQGYGLWRRQRKLKVGYLGRPSAEPSSSWTSSRNSAAARSRPCASRSRTGSSPWRAPMDRRASRRGAWWSAP